MYAVTATDAAGSDQEYFYTPTPSYSCGLRKHAPEL